MRKRNVCDYAGVYKTQKMYALLKFSFRVNGKLHPQKYVFSKVLSAAQLAS